MRLIEVLCCVAMISVFAGVMGSCFRTAVKAKAENDRKERVLRRPVYMENVQKWQKN